jgi:hypothetical protein
VLNHWPPGNLSESLARKTGRLKSRGDDGENRRCSQRKRKARDRHRVHGEFYHIGLRRLGYPQITQITQITFSGFSFGFSFFVFRF